LPNIEETINNKRHIDWSFSYVLHKSPSNLKEIVNFANENNFTHIRVVSNILNSDKNLMQEAKKVLTNIDDRVIYQDRSKPTAGSKNCYISLLKPIIGADGYVYPCCGIQYHSKGIKRDFNHDMGNDLEDIMNNQKNFRGDKCQKCYYSSYNNLLSLLKKETRHKEWL